MVRKAEVYGTHRSADSIATHAFLKYTFEDKLKDSEVHLSTWWPNKIERTHVEHLPSSASPSSRAPSAVFWGFHADMWRPSKNIVDKSATTVEGGAGFSLGSTCPITEERELNMMKASLAVGVR